MTLIKWEPWGEIDRLMDQTWVSSPSFGGDLAVDVSEGDGNITVDINMPGVEPKEIKVNVEGNHLRVSGNREEEKEKKGEHYFSREIRRGSFERIIQLPSAVQADSAKAKYKNGKLAVTLTKRDPEIDNGSVNVEVE